MRKLNVVFCVLVPLIVSVPFFSSPINFQHTLGRSYQENGPYPPPEEGQEPFGDYRISLPLVHGSWQYLPNIPTPSDAVSKYIIGFGTNNSVLYSAGCELGQKALNTSGDQDYFVYLGFGEAYIYPGGTIGARLLNSYEIKSSTEIKNAVVEYSRGFFICSGTDFNSRLTIGVGVSNSSAYSTNSTHGYLWADLVSQISTQVYNQSSVTGSANLELSFNSAYATSAWVNGYKNYLEENSLSAVFPLYVVGDAAGCASLDYPDRECSVPEHSDWNTNYVWYVNYGNGISFPIPEIYYDWYQAEQWMLLSLYDPSDPMLFVGSFTQYGACQQFPDDESCLAGGNNVPSEGYGQLFTVLSSNPTTRSVINSLIYSSDISYAVP